ncbi:MAG: four helix bundle protein [Calditrichaeota bacterium]|nr:MAG: four helix bundle protein [Calditrichota bacterium]
MKGFNDYRDLEVWQRGMHIAQEIYKLTQDFPNWETYGMTSQLRRAAASIPANIAEGWGRRYRAEFIQYLRYANGSRTELETHLILSARVGLCTEETIQSLLMDLETLGKQLLNLERSLRRKKNS